MAKPENIHHHISTYHDDSQKHVKLMKQPSTNSKHLKICCCESQVSKKKKANLDNINPQDFRL